MFAIMNRPLDDRSVSRMTRVLLCAMVLPFGLIDSLAAWGEEKVPAYAEHQDLTYYLDGEGTKHPIKTVKEWEIRKKHIQAHLQAVMGPIPGNDKRSPLEMKVESEEKVGELTRKKITYQTEPGDRVAAWLYIPPGKGPFAAVLCLHQTTASGKDEPAGLGGSPNLQYALHIAERGYVTLTPDYPSFGEHNWEFTPDNGYVSGTMKAIWDNIRSVDLLESFTEVDKQRIGCIGHSLGGHNTLFTAIFEPRIKVAVSSCGFCTFLKDDVPSWTGPVYMPRIASVYENDAAKVPFDFTEIVGGLAPRPFLACAATGDSDFDVSGVKDVMRIAQPVYDLYKKGESLQGYYPEAPHDFPKDARDVAYEFMDKYLKRAGK